MFLTSSSFWFCLYAVCGADQLEAVGHDFFVFLDSNDSQMKVVYRRKYSGYGLLIPTVQA